MPVGAALVKTPHGHRQPSVEPTSTRAPRKLLQFQRSLESMGVWERKAKAGAIGGVTGFMVGGAAAALQMRGRHAGPAALFLACVIGAGAAFRQT